MKSWVCCIGLVAVAILTCPSCGGDDSSPTGSGGSGGSGGAGGSGGGDGSVACDRDAAASQTLICTTTSDCDKIDYTGTAAPVYTCNSSKSTRYPDGPNACRNDADCAMINTPPSGIRQIVRECALSNRDKQPDSGVPEAERIAACQNVAAANTMCVRDATSMKFMPPGISDACGKCYTDIALCSSAYCLAECIADADAIGCIKCQFTYGCRVPFEKCSGVDRQ